MSKTLSLYSNMSSDEEDLYEGGGEFDDEVEDNSSGSNSSGSGSKQRRSSKHKKGSSKRHKAEEVARLKAANDHLIKKMDSLRTSYHKLVRQGGQRTISRSISKAQQSCILNIVNEDTIQYYPFLDNEIWFGASGLSEMVCSRLKIPTDQKDEYMKSVKQSFFDKTNYKRKYLIGMAGKKYIGESRVRSLRC